MPRTFLGCDAGTSILVLAIAFLFFLFSVIIHLLSIPTQYERGLMKDFLFSSTPIEIPPHFQVTPLHTAAGLGRIDQMESLLSTIPINVQDNYLNTPLHSACARGNDVSIEFLLKRGADPNIPNIADRTPLHIAIEHYHNHIIQILIEYGADVDEMAHDQSPVYMAVLKRNLEALKMLLEKNANAGIRDHQQDTPLHIAAANNLVEYTQYLVDARGVYIDAENLDGETPLFRAISDNACDVVPLLIKKGAQLERPVGPKKGTLLHQVIDTFLFFQSQSSQVIDTYSMDCAQYLLEGGANVNALNEDNETPLYAAVKWRMKDMVKLLLWHDAKKSIGKDPMTVPTSDEIKKLLSEDSSL